MRLLHSLPLALLIPAGAWAQESPQSGVPVVSPIAIGERVTLYSKVLRERRTLNVFVPRRVAGADTTGRFIVVYILDGGDSYLHAISAVTSLVWEEDMPPAIVVSVNNTDRNRDFTPRAANAATVPAGWSSGGADGFLDFLEREAIPLIDARYPTLPHRVLIGHSLGGLLAVHALTMRPALFKGVIALDPSMWWDEGAAIRRLLMRLSRPDAPIPRLIVAEGGSNQLRPYWALVQQAANSRGIVEFIDVPNESHTGIQFMGRYRALRQLFAEYVPRYRSDATMATRAALDAQYRALSSRWGYTVPVPAFAIAGVARRQAAPGRR